MATKKSTALQVPTEPTDSTHHLDLSKAVRLSLPHLKLSTETISLRMPATLLESIKIEANKRAVPYQSLIKMTLADQARISPPAPQRKLFDADKHRRRMKETWGDRVFSAEEVREMREAELGDRS